ncbi:uncharacterized protein LOC133300039 [Gastrolobium bilobum]|uniref:uncharacterized protein LOC133300039 n=1 Tax=Gastrolobium bilobum TaxID=150636 RepID=UPI002AB11A66|nr:uncharacterized protein LOC133300039 [Gastrolobium bilobum]
MVSKSNLPNTGVDPNSGTASRPVSPHVPNQDPFAYPVSLSGRGFIPKGSLAYSPEQRQYPNFPHPKVAPSRSDSNGCKDTSTREGSRDDVIRDRKVRVTEDASLYGLCRSWLKNGVNDENQPQQKDVMKALPKPLPASMVAGYMSNKKDEEKDDDEHEENEESVELLSPQDLLKKHIKRAKKVRARLREQRLQRITRYRSRLKLLLSPPVEQFRNDTAAGNRPC